ncbi:hypothetical protein IFM46972_01512 [Aspergillus udagawae]|uniref:Uncharacterized protein n=1 Tax=Aspergillus udagawae TaxID=91492 RepID=A0A8H3N3I7_9EURO|nr:hypothetical protein IFM46972_01512 [Aspergillus udagawae]
MATESSNPVKYYLQHITELRKPKPATDSKESSLKDRFSSFKLKATPSKADEHSGYGLKRGANSLPALDAQLRSISSHFCLFSRLALVLLSLFHLLGTSSFELPLLLSLRKVCVIVDEYNA